MKFLPDSSNALRPIAAAVITSCFFLICSVAAADANVLTFQAWKTSRVDEARGNVEKLQADKTPQANIGKELEKKSEPESLHAMSLKTSRGGEQKLQQAQFSLDVAKDLTVNDYFVLYLSQFKNNRDAFIEAAKKLSPEETADLMMSYQKHLASNQDVEEIVPSSAGVGLGAQPISAK